MFHCCALLFIFFFFQAKEGIRFDCVTGFQKCLFFFSSRRRHTRSLCDWSSDVCSSDHTVISYAVFCLRSEEHTSELQSHSDLVCRLLLEKKTITISVSIKLVYVTPNSQYDKSATQLLH